MRSIRRKARVIPARELRGASRGPARLEKYWILLKFLFSWITCLITPVIVCIIQDVVLDNGVAVLGICCDVFCFIELLVQLLQFSPYRNASRKPLQRQGIVESSKMDVVSFAVDMIAVFPLVGVPVAKAASVSGSRLALLCIPRMIKTINVVRLYYSLKSKFKDINALVNDTLSRVLFTFVLTTIHLSTFASLWFYISCPHRGTCPHKNAWVAEDEYLNSSSTLSAYVRSLHFVVQTLFTIGFGDISPVNNVEIVFAMFLILNGSLFYGFLISSITSLLSNKDVSTKFFRSEMATLKTLLALRDVPDELRLRVDGLFNFLFTRQCGQLECEFLCDIPRPLLREIKRTYAAHLSTVPFFEHMPVRLVNLATEKLTFRTYAPGAVVFFQSERRRELLLVRSGRIEVKVEGSRSALFTCMAGDSIGDFQLLFGTPSEVKAEAAAYTEVMVLSYDALVEAIVESNDHHRKLDVETWLSTKQQSVEATIESHKKFLMRVLKVRTSIEESSKKKRMAEMMADVVTETRKFVILPNSIFRAVWSMVVILMTFYFLLAVPFRILAYIDCYDGSIGGCLSQWDWSLVVDYFLDALFIVDILLNSFFFAFTHFESEQHVVVADPREIFNKFIGSWRAYVSLVAVIPLDLLAPFIGYVLCLRLSKLLWGILLFENISNFLNFFEKQRNVTLISTEGITVVHLSIVTLFVCLWTAIGWSLLHVDGSGSAFAESLYWCITTMTTVGYGDVVADSTSTTVYVVVSSIVGSCTCATIIANAASYFHNTDTSVGNIGHRKEVVKTFLQTISVNQNQISMNVDDKLLRKSLDEKEHMGVLAYLDYMDRERQGMDEAKLISSMLPDYLQEDLRQFMVMDSVLSSKLFSQCDSGFIRQLMLSIELQFVVSGSVIISPGTPASGMYFVQSGLVQILTAQGRKTQKLSHGDSFAEIFLFEESGYCNFRAEAYTNSEIWYLRRSKFQELVREHGLRSTKDVMENMHEAAKTAAKSIIDTPAPSIRALQVIHEMGVIDSDNVFVKPQSMGYNIWLVILTLVTIYNLLLILARVTFMEGVESVISPFLGIDCLGDIMYVVDIILRMFFLAYTDKNELVMSRAKIKANYLSHNFIIHAFASIPFDILVLSGALPGLSLGQTLAVYRLNKLARVLDLPSHVQSYEDVLFTKLSSGFRYAIRIFKLMFVVFLSAHVVGCLFFIVGNQAHINGNGNNWADSAGILRSCSFKSYGQSDNCNGPPPFDMLLSQYVYSIYWATATLTTVGYGDIAAVSLTEHIFSLFVFIVGTAVYTMVVTCLQDIVSHLDVTSDIYRNRCDRIKRLLLREKSSDELMRKASAYMDKLWTLQRGAQSHEIRQFVSPHIYSELTANLLRNKIDNLFFVKQCHSGFRYDISARMDLQHYMSPDFIFHSGEAALSIYIMISGEVSFVNEGTGQQYSKLFSSVGILGESEFFTKACYSCAAQAISDVVCFELTYESFWELVEHYGYEDQFESLLRVNFVALWKTSTAHLVQTLNGNLKNSKMSRIVSTDKKTTRTEFCILPDSNFSRIWTLLTVMFGTYIAATVPFFIAFSQIDVTVGVFDTMLFVFFSVDIYLNLRYFALDEDGVLMTCRSEYSAIYIDRHLKWDVVSSLPIALLWYGITRNVSTFVFLRILYLMRLRGVNRHFQRLLTIVESISGKRLSADHVRILKMVAVMWYFGHLACCMLCWIGVQGESSWIQENEYDNMSSVSIYSRGYLWAIYTIVTVGYGNISMATDVERIYSIFIMITGAILCDAGVTAVLSSIIENVDKQSGSVRRSRESMIQFCASNQFNESIRSSVAMYYDYLSSDLDNSVELSDFRLIPKPLLLEFIQLNCFDALCSLCLLDTEASEYQLGFVYSMVRFIEPTIATPGQVILCTGDDTDIHILRKGRAFARYYNSKGESSGDREYFQEGEALCREGRLNTSSAMSPGKLVTVKLGALRDVSPTKSSSSPFAPKTLYARLNCGARKTRSTQKSTSRGRTIWNETFTFHAPRAATDIRILVFNDREAKDGGLCGKAVIKFDELESMAVCDTNIEGPSVRRKESMHSSRRVYCANESSRREGSRRHRSIRKQVSVPEVVEFSDNTDSDSDNEDDEVQDVSYHVKQDMRDKNGRLVGIVDVEITIKNAGDEKKKQSTFLKRQLSTKTVDVVAETFCHLFSIHGKKLAELRNFFGNYLEPSKRKETAPATRNRGRRRSSFVNPTLIDIIRKRSTVAENSNVVVPQTEECESSPPNFAAIKRRDDLIDFSHKQMRRSETIDSGNRPVSFQSQQTSADTGVSDGEIEEALGLSSLVQNLRKGVETRSEFAMSWIK